MTDAQPSSQDIENARIRAEVAARFQQEFDQCAARAEQLFGPGYEPSHRHFLLDKEDEDRCRRTGERPKPAATVYTVRYTETGLRRHFMLHDGKPLEVGGYASAFGEMLNEKHPTMRIEVSGEMVAPHRYSLCWAPIETYKPKTALQLAEARARRQLAAVGKEALANPLFAEQILAEGYQPPQRKRGPKER